MSFEAKFFTRFPMEPDVYPDPPSTINGLTLKWDNSDIGPIDDSVVFYKKMYDEDLLYLWEKKKNRLRLTPIRILKYKDDIPFIVEDFKKIFMIPTSGKHKAILRDNPCIITKYESDIPYENYFETHSKEGLSKGFIKEMQRLYVFKYLMCINCNFENRVEIRQCGTDIYPVSCRESKFSFTTDSRACRFPQTIIKEWFNNDDYMPIMVAKEMIDEMDINTLRFRLSDIIHKYEHGKYIGWVNTIYNRLQMVKNI